MGVLRILLAICVYCDHSRPIAHLRWIGEDLAVELFFVISGFYMQLVLHTKYTRAKLGNGWITQFYKARYFRLLPVYLAAGALVVIPALLYPKLTPHNMWTFIAALPNTAGNIFFKAYLVLTNSSMLFQDATMFFSVHNGQVHWSSKYWNSDAPLWKALIIPQAWSLGVELNFYLIAPFLLNLRARWLLFAAVCSLILKVTVVQGFHLGDPWTYRFFPFELGYFLMGALAFRYRERLERILQGRLERYGVYLLAAGFAIARLPVPMVTVICPLTLALALPFMFRVTAGIKFDRLIGELSYPFYVFHLFALTVSGIAARRWWGDSQDIVLWTGLVLTLVLSAISLALEIRFIEPWRSRFVERRSSHRPEATQPGPEVVPLSSLPR